MLILVDQHNLFSDSYVHNKLGDSAWIPAKDRCALCEGALKYEDSQLSSWVTVSRGESEWAGGFVDFDEVTENLCTFLNDLLVSQRKVLKHPLRVLYVCGLDHFNKCTHVESMAKKENIACAIVYRAGCDEHQVCRAVKSSGAIYVPLASERDQYTHLSSTEIRKYFQNPSASTASIAQLIYPNVRDYMKQKSKK